MLIGLIRPLCRAASIKRKPMTLSSTSLDIDNAGLREGLTGLAFDPLSLVGRGFHLVFGGLPDLAMPNSFINLIRD